VHGVGRARERFAVIKGGVLNSYAFNRIGELDPAAMKGELSFAQISDSHMGFNKPANTGRGGHTEGGGGQD